MPFLECAFVIIIRMKSIQLILSLFLTVFVMQTIAVVHDAVHPFHAHPVESELHDITQHDHVHHQTQAAGSVDVWLCDLWDKVTHHAFNISAKLSFETVGVVTPGLVVVRGFFVSNPFYPSFWGRAPPSYFV